jgi:hypothetical protein
MDAYELADFIETGGENIDRKELSMMLRQQADRIAELEKCLFQMQNACVYLTKPSAEPFIWLKQDFDGEWIEVHPNKGIPLYTTPQIKELSDEEISLVIWESYQSIGNATLTNLCKAILKKANEK